MSKVFSTTAAAIALSFGLAAMGSAPALAANYHDYHPWAQSSTRAGYAGLMPVYARKYHQDRPDYAGWASTSGAPVGPWEFVPGRGIEGESCDMPSSTCSNDERIND
jgi:hypothetical protein